MGGRGVYGGPFLPSYLFIPYGGGLGSGRGVFGGLYFSWGVVLLGLDDPCPGLLWFYLSWVVRLSWDFFPGFPPFEAVAALVAKHIPYICLGNLGFSFGKCVIVCFVLGRSPLYLWLAWGIKRFLLIPRGNVDNILIRGWVVLEKMFNWFSLSRP